MRTQRIDHHPTIHSVRPESAAQEKRLRLILKLRPTSGPATRSCLASRTGVSAGPSDATQRALNPWLATSETRWDARRRPEAARAARLAPSRGKLRVPLLRLPREGSGVLADISGTGALLEQTSFVPVRGELIGLSLELPLPGACLMIGWVSRHTKSGFAIEFDESDADTQRLARDIGAIVPVRPRPDRQAKS